ASSRRRSPRGPTAPLASWAARFRNFDAQGLGEAIGSRGRIDRELPESAAGSNEARLVVPRRALGKRRSERGPRSRDGKARSVDPRARHGLSGAIPKSEGQRDGAVRAACGGELRVPSEGAAPPLGGDLLVPRECAAV